MSQAKKMKRRKKREVNEYMRLHAKYNQALIMQTVHEVGIILYYSAREVFGFGEIRLKRLYQKMKAQASCLREKYVTLDEIKSILRDEAKIDLRPSGRPDDSIEGKIQSAVVDELSATILLSLLDEYGFKAKRLARFYQKAIEFSRMVKDKEIKVEDMQSELKKVSFCLTW